MALTILKSWWGLIPLVESLCHFSSVTACCWVNCVFTQMFDCKQSYCCKTKTERNAAHEQTQEATSDASPVSQKSHHPTLWGATSERRLRVWCEEMLQPALGQLHKESHSSPDKHFSDEFKISVCSFKPSTHCVNSGPLYSCWVLFTGWLPVAEKSLKTELLKTRSKDEYIQDSQRLSGE